MEAAEFTIQNIPAVLYGQASHDVYLFVHGKCGYKEEAKKFAEQCGFKGWQVLSVDLPEHGARRGGAETFDPWHVVPELQAVMVYARRRWKRVALYANSIGAWFSMLAFQKEPPAGCLFVSPVLDMACLIERMMAWSGVTAEELQMRGEIGTDFGETLSWRYYQYAKEHPINVWTCPTAILYAGGDHLTPRREVDAFVHRFPCDLTVMENGEHWFHTPEQLQVLENWTASHAEIGRNCVIEVVAALILDGGKFLACQRPPHKARGLLWEFLGGKVEPGETGEQAIIRECREEIGVTIAVEGVCAEVTHVYPDVTVHLTLFRTAISEGAPQKIEHHDIRWLTIQEAAEYAFCPADKTFLQILADSFKE